MDTKKREKKYFKGRYGIFFYDEKDEQLLMCFDNVKEIVMYKNKAFTKQNYDLVKVEIYRAQKRDHRTRMLDGTPMRVHLIDVIDIEEE